MQLQFRRGTYSKQLLPGDTERLLYGIGQLGHNLENVRAEAIKVYSESRYLSPLTYLNSTGMEYDFGQPQPGACPVAEPRKSVCIEARRKQLVEFYFKKHVEAAITNLKEKWDDPTYKP